MQILDTQYKESGLLRKLEALDTHILRASSPDSPYYSVWGIEWANKKRQLLYKEFKLCRVLKEKT